MDHPGEVDARSFDDLVADCADLTRQLLVLRPVVVPAPRSVITIPEGALTVVSGLDDYGD
jgi:hypothetical protein